MSVTIRRATFDDLPVAYDIQRESSAAAGMEIGNVAGPADGRVPAKFRHEFHHGRFLIAEVDACALGFGAVFQRANVAFLATFYVRPGAQMAGLGVGQKLLDALFDGLGPVHCVVSSSVSRAIAIYARNGMLPRWPLFMLEAQSERLPVEKLDQYRAKPAEIADPALVDWDAQIARRGKRAIDHAYWREEYRGIPFWIERDDERVGYAYIQHTYESSDAPWNPDAVILGPIGVRDRADAAGAVMAVVDAARDRASRLLIDAPGSHPALPHLLDAGFRIFYQATFCSSSSVDVFDPRCYIPADTITL